MSDTRPPLDHALDPGDDAFSAQAKVQRGVDTDVRETLLGAWGLEVEAATELTGGEASSVWQVTSGQRKLVVRIAPARHPIDQLEASSGLQAHLSARIAAVPPPLPTLAGAWVAIAPPNPITVQTFQPGIIKRRFTDADIEAAASMLAALHVALDGVGMNGQVEPEPRDLRLDLPDILNDPELDRFVAALPERGFHRTWLHGDYYSRNALWSDDAITGVLDWDEASVDWREHELAWSMWEFCHNESGTDLVVDRANRFLAAYLARGPEIAGSFAADAASFIRRRLRWECLDALDRKAAGLPFDWDYLDSEIAAFRNLRERELAV